MICYRYDDVMPITQKYCNVKKRVKTLIKKMGGGGEQTEKKRMII